MARAELQTSSNHAFTVEQVRGLFLGQRNVLLANLVVGFIFAVLNYLSDRKPLMLIWFASLFAVLAYRHFNFLKLLRAGLLEANSEMSSDVVSHQLRVFRWGVFGSALCWGIGGWLMIHHDDYLMLSYTILAIGGMTAGSVNALALDRVSGVIFLVLTPAPTLLGLLANGMPGVWSLGLLLIVGVVFVGIISRKTTAWVSQLLELKVATQAQSIALANSEAHLKFALETANQAAIDVDWRTRAELWSDHWPEMLGYRAGTETFEVKIHPDDAPTVTVESEHFAAGRSSSLDVEYRARHRDGHWVWVHERARGIEVDASGAVLRSVGTREDISQTKQLQEQLNNAERLRSIGQLAGGVAHDFNNNLTAMSINIDLLQMQFLSDEAKQTVEELAEMVKRAASTTQQLLLFARKTKVHGERLELNRRIEGLMRIFSRLLGETVRLKLEIHSAQIWIEADGALLDQALINLAINARDAMPRGGLLSITIRDCVLDQEQLHLRQPDRQDLAPGCFVEIEVKDSGVGMDTLTLSRIFEPFFTTKGVGKGTGLGLASVLAMAEHHRGFIEVDSAVNAGSCFKLFLPVLEMTAVRAESAEKPGITADVRLQNSKRILVIEDEPLVRDSIARMLKHLGYEVFTAVDAHHAMQVWKAEAGQFDVILCDLIMPGERNGLDLLTELRALRPSLNFVLMSGYSPESITQEANEAIARNQLQFLEKPFNLKKLNQVMASVLQ